MLSIIFLFLLGASLLGASLLGAFYWVPTAQTKGTDWVPTAQTKKEIFSGVGRRPKITLIFDLESSNDQDRNVKHKIWFKS